MTCSGRRGYQERVAFQLEWRYLFHTPCAALVEKSGALPVKCSCLVFSLVVYLHLYREHSLIITSNNDKMITRNNDNHISISQTYNNCFCDRKKLPLPPLTMLKHSVERFHTVVRVRIIDPLLAETQCPHLQILKVSLPSTTKYNIYYLNFIFHNS